MNLPTDFPELEVLLEKTGATFERFKPIIDIQLQRGGVPVSLGEFDVIDDKIPIVRKRKVALYLQDAGAYQIKYHDLPKYHIVYCKTLQNMRKYGHYDRYHATRRTNGDFLVKLSTSDELSPLKLNFCKNCLDKLKEQHGSGVFPADPSEFPLADWFETFDEDLDKTAPSHVPFDYSSEAWQGRSLACREKANWTCLKCDINLETDRHLLHAHHQWGTQYNNLQDLMALCIRCHAEQPGEGHQLLKDYSEYQEFIKKYGDISQSSQRFDLLNQQPRRIREQPTPTYVQTTVTEEDSPF